MTDLAAIFLDILGPVALVVACGFVAGRRLEVDAGTLAALAFWVLGPAFIYHTLATAELAADLVGRLVGVSLASIAVTAFFTVVFSRVLSFDRSLGSAALMTSIWGNVGNFGLAVVVFTFGESALPIAGVLMLTINMTGLIVGVVAAESRTGSIAAAIRRGVTAPMSLAVIPAVIVNVGNVDVPAVVARPVELVSRALIPVMLIALGIQLAGMGRPDFSRAMAVPLVAKMIVFPLAALGLTGLFGLEGMPAGAVTIQAAMPAAVFTAVVAMEEDLEPDFVTRTVVAGTLLSMLTLPVIISLAR